MSSAKPPLTAEARYRLLVEAVTDYAIYMLDPDGFVVSWNPGAERLKGYTEQEIVGRHFSQFYPPEDAAAGVPARALATAARESRFEAEGWRVRKSGERFWAHVVIDPIRTASGELLGFAKVTRDLSERRSAEESLRRSEEQFRLLVQGVTDYAIYMLDTQGQVTSWNSGAQRIKGYLPEEVIGTHFSRFYRTEDRERGHPDAALATAAREGRFESEGWRVRKDGSTFWASAVIDPIRDDAGHVVGFAKVTRDVTEKREAQLALEQAREALFQSQKLDAIGQLTGGVAHDFNNLLMVVLSSLEVLRRRLPSDEKIQRLIDTAVRGAQRGVTLTQRMLAFARRQDLNPTAVDVPALIQGMLDLLRRSLGPTIHIEIDLPQELPMAKVDSNQLELALLNLAVNARDAMPRGGTLTISTHLGTIATAEGPMAQGHYIVIGVADTGFGMDADTMGRAMEPFFTTKGVGKGTGLGLSMVHGLAAQSGGQFVLRSVEGTGTTGELWLPLAEAGVEASPPPAPTNQVLRHSAPMVVVAVDDDSLVLESTRSMLEDLGHTVLAAGSGAAALDLVRTEPGVALVVTDQVMPGMAGSGLIEQLRELRPELPVILATGFSDSFHAFAGAVRLNKPFDQQQLSDAISDALAERTAERGSGTIAAGT
ncbi:MAG: PAS domain S-box protein [Burkholderiales bacterium]